jgi:hypothetical protein
MLRALGVHTVVTDFSPVLVRALSLFGPGELRELRVLDVDVFQLVMSLVPTASASEEGGPALQIQQSMDALCAIQVGGYIKSLYWTRPDIGSLAALLQRHSSTVTEVNADLPAEMLNEVSSALGCCTRLESLTYASRYAPANWLGLSQLHTLHGVDLGQVSFAAIAAALPKLHVLKASGPCNRAARTVFFTDLLPRLWVFHFEGTWHKQPTSTVRPLPLLQELVWRLPPDAYGDIIAPREFLGAQPTVLHAPHALISQCWLGAADASENFLERVCDLRIVEDEDADPLDPSNVARVLCAAPRLKKFVTDHGVRRDASWLAPTAPTHSAFQGLVHPRLRKFGVARAEPGDWTSKANQPGTEWVAHLRRRHFPRLCELVVDNEAYFVTPHDGGVLHAPQPKQAGSTPKKKKTK